MIIGVVGKANVGKSTFFKAATLAEVEIGNYPFVTIKANSGVGYVKVKCVDQEFGVQCDPRKGYCKNGIRFVPVELIDVAGLVPGAHEGKGMGNQFLDDIRQADVLIHVIDGSGGTNEKGERYQCGTYRQRYACGTERYRCGNETYRYACGTETYRAVCRTRQERYACGCN